MSFEFINVTTVSGRERRRNNYLARSHAAKVNRQNYKAQAEGWRSNNGESLLILPKSAASRQLPPSLTAGEDLNVEDDTDSKETLQLRRFQDPNRELDHRSAQESGGLSILETCASVTPRTISPAYGGLFTDTFDLKAEPVSAQIGHYCMCSYSLRILKTLPDTGLQC